MEKQNLRVWAKEKRKELDMKYLSSVLTVKLTQTNEYKNAKNIMLFYPLPDEVNLLSLLSDTTKQFFLPRVNGQNLECCRYKEGDNLYESCFHTLEPICMPCENSQIDLIIVPALACDINNYRLGYGGGYYDRFLKNYNGVKVSCIPAELIVDSVFPQEHDIKMDIIINS